MANWCDNTIAFICGETGKSELMRLHNTLKEIYAANSPHDIWLDKVVTAHGLDVKQIPCRGELYDVGEYDGDTLFFTIGTCTAWSRQTNCGTAS